jgi:hypothetical protein
MQEDVLKDISNKMDIIVKLLANQVISERNVTDSTFFLSSLGLSSKDISKLLNTKQNVVAARLSNAKKRSVK